MNSEKERTLDYAKFIFFILVFILASNISVTVLKTLFNLRLPTIHCLLTLFFSLGFYPLFIRGTTKRWSKSGEKRTFRAWLPFCLILSILSFFYAAFFYGYE